MTIPTRQPRTVLLVDDEARVTRTLARALTRLGWTVHTTNKAFGVLNLVAQLRPWAVVLDLRMPGLSGLELAELLRSDPELAGTRIVLCSGVGAAELVQTARLTAADAYVAKGSNPAQLHQTLQRLATASA